MDYALIWATIIAFAILLYALLDGFDLGLGLLFPFLSDEEKDMAVHTIAPVWDGNETWLVLGGGGLYATFPLAYSTLLTAFYPLIIAMLLALVFRGVSMEFRHKATYIRHYWDKGFFLGSLTAALAQGIMLGAFIQGVKIGDRAYAGGWFDWLTPFSLLCGFAVVAGYALLGTSWMVMKTGGPVTERLRSYLVPLSITVFALIVLVSSWTPLLDTRLTERWFGWPNLLYLAPIPLAVTVITGALIKAARAGEDSLTFYLAEALFVVTFAGFGISTYPFIVPQSITIWDAASPDSSLKFLLAGTVFILPIILAYTANSYYVFRGKVHAQGNE